MNKYLIAVCDESDSSANKIYKFNANSWEDAKSKIMDYFINKYNIDRDFDIYEDFDNFMFNEMYVTLSEIYDIEELC